MRVPTSTYRLQLNADFTLAHLRGLIEYFQALGVGDLYFSPIFQARAKSPHGYDVINPAHVNREIGDEAHFASLSRELHDLEIGIILDIVPNHMAATEENPWWFDILKHGPNSIAAHFFDVEWSAPGCENRIILPILGKELDQAIDDGEIKIAERDGEPFIDYFGRLLPVSPETAIGATRDVRDILRQQHYSLEFWRSGTRRLNYRRFFDITDLAGVRVEADDVFAVTHSLILDLIRDQLIDGVRVDHVDGLRDPKRYLQDLRKAIGDTYVVVEKILAPDEEMREDWPIEGTTGYDFVGMVAGLFVEPSGLRRLTDDYAERTGLPSFKQIVYEKKKFVMDALFNGELDALTRELARIANLIPILVDPDEIRRCIAEVTAALPVYRTYISEEIDPRDHDMIIAVAPQSKACDLFKQVVLGKDIPDELRKLRMEFVANWQQFTGPVMAKGLEDTSFYTYHRLISLNEVGAHPDYTPDINRFHAIMKRRAIRWPYTMNGSSTHDTKRSEDVRARIHVLSEITDKWLAFLDKWTGRLDGVNDEIMLLQTLIGAWPLHGEEMDSLKERLHAFIQKSSREAKDKSSWIDPNEEYEKSLNAYVDALIDDADFRADFETLHTRVARYGALNSLAQLLIKITAPGIPDIYQGNESWIFSLVDPDNRRPVDFTRLQNELNAMPLIPEPGTVREYMESWQDGRIKLHVTRAGLNARREKLQLFANGDYLPITATGKHADNIIAFARRRENEWALTVTGRFYSQIEDWGDTTLQLPADAPREWVNVLTGEKHRATALAAALVFDVMPVALLFGTSGA